MHLKFEMFVKVYLNMTEMVQKTQRILSDV